MPIGVQIVGKPFEEELVLRVLLELENSHRRKQ
jgi:Asp-tRNA(Asn)/Glu-tRNA(Gln) amidotransferase A subunit family amidase